MDTEIVLDLGDFESLPSPIISAISDFVGVGTNMGSLNTDFNALLIRSEGQRKAIQDKIGKYRLRMVGLCVNCKPIENGGLEFLFQLLMKKPFKHFEEVSESLKEINQFVMKLLTGILVQLEMLHNKYKQDNEMLQIILNTFVHEWSHRLEMLRTDCAMLSIMTTIIRKSGKKTITRTEEMMGHLDDNWGETTIMSRLGGLIALSWDLFPACEKIILNTREQIACFEDVQIMVNGMSDEFSHASFESKIDILQVIRGCRKRIAHGRKMIGKEQEEKCEENKKEEEEDEHQEKQLILEAGGYLTNVVEEIVERCDENEAGATFV